jgi:hypothetical protein
MRRRLRNKILFFKSEVNETKKRLFSVEEPLLFLGSEESRRQILKPKYQQASLFSRLNSEKFQDSSISGLIFKGIFAIKECCYNLLRSSRKERD